MIKIKNEHNIHSIQPRDSQAMESEEYGDDSKAERTLVKLCGHT